MNIVRSLIKFGGEELAAEFEEHFRATDGKPLGDREIAFLVSQALSGIPLDEVSVGGRTIRIRATKDGKKRQMQFACQVVEAMVRGVHDCLREGELTALGIPPNSDSSERIPRGAFLSGHQINFDDGTVIAPTGETTYYAVELRETQTRELEKPEGSTSDTAGQTKLEGRGGRGRKETQDYIKYYSVLCAEYGRDLDASSRTVKLIKERMKKDNFKSQYEPSNRGLIDAIKRFKAECQKTDSKAL